MARVILEGFRSYEEALAFAEWFGYAGAEVDTPEQNFVVEADVVSSRIETDTVELGVFTRNTEFVDTGFSSETDYGDIFKDDEDF